MNLRHYFTHYSSLGGVQSIIGTHLKYDEIAGMDPSLLAFFDPAENQEKHQKVSGLCWNGLTNINAARNDFKRNESGKSHDCCVYHDLWGLAFLADLDHCHHRIGAIHSHWPHLEYQLKQLDGFLDGVFCDSQALADIALKNIPSLTPDRAVHLPVPIKTCPHEYRTTRLPLIDRQLKLGFTGRVDHLQKRVERFIPLVNALEMKGIQYELEFLGDGTGRKYLEKAFHTRENITFHGKKLGAEYWKIMGEWDFVIYTSDFEGSPLAMQEALNAGCLPIFPSIQCGGDLVVKEISEDLLYKPEDYQSIAYTLLDWQKRPPSFVEATRKKGIQVSSEYAEDKYHVKFKNFLNHILNQPVISKHPMQARRRFWADILPFAALKRYYPKGFFNYREK